MKMNFKTESGTLTIYLEGRIDSGNVDAVSAELDGVISGNPAERLVLDADELQYISSAGLRMILRLRKENATLKIINANSEVYEIFDMTGFTEMLDIEKAYRKMSVEGCKVIGQGANGKVYRLDDEIIIKVYFNSDALPDIQRERELARKAFVLGIPTAIPFDIVRVDGSYGSVFELLNADSFAELMAKEPENVGKYTDLYVDLLKKIHSTEVKKTDMPDMKAVALNWATFLKDYLSADKYEKLYSLIENVPERTTMLHGDYHIKNVMMQNGEVLLIDMDTLCYGDPVFEFASIYLAYIGYAEMDHEIVKNFIGIDYETACGIWENTLKLYFGTEDEAVLREYSDKARIVGYTRLIRRNIRRGALETEKGRAEIENAKKQLCELLDRVESLKF